ncbi:hypothetical protein PYCCODRAFT_5517 [Trametes coccinea BRFM310]|uniref:Uncharacterized protein n=1 Tax=Trametes coccinea (strain BRFM310) TaxID=1353009 RepID=A0A1Y2J719_TRAC3|nr:hypothetical protein PYCCODRAFT_5517 [Trametes coccinea BRFM310]
MGVRAYVLARDRNARAVHGDENGGARGAQKWVRRTSTKGGVVYDCESRPTRETSRVAPNRMHARVPYHANVQHERIQTLGGRSVTSRHIAPDWCVLRFLLDAAGNAARDLHLRDDLIQNTDGVDRIHTVTEPERPSLLRMFAAMLHVIFVHDTAYCCINTARRAEASRTAARLDSRAARAPRWVLPSCRRRTDDACAPGEAAATGGGTYLHVALSPARLACVLVLASKRLTKAKASDGRIIVTCHRLAIFDGLGRQCVMHRESRWCSTDRARCERVGGTRVHLDRTAKRVAALIAGGGNAGCLLPWWRGAPHSLVCFRVQCAEARRDRRRSMSNANGHDIGRASSQSGVCVLYVSECIFVARPRL